jgi:hypothetical protein
LDNPDRPHISSNSKIYALNIATKKSGHNFMAVEGVNPTPEDLQKKVYFLLEQLQLMARELPP